MANPFDLTDRVAMVTGASRGLGEHFARVLARAGADGPLGPGLGPGVSFSSLASPELADNGVVFTGAGLSNGGSTIAVISPAGIDIAAMTGTEGPLGPALPGHRFDSVGSPQHLADGDLVFGGRVDPPFDFNFGNEQDTGLWLIEDGGPPEPLLLADTEAGFGPGVEVKTVLDNFGTNERGDVVVRVRLVGPGVIVQQNDEALIALVDGEQLPIVREGDLFDVDPGPAEDLRTISGLSPSGDPRDDGLFYLQLRFTDGSRGNFTVQLPIPVPGDYNNNGVVDAADYTVWRDNLGAPEGTLPNDTDGGAIGQAQYDTWKANFGNTLGAGSGSIAQVPEPSTTALAFFAWLIGCAFRLRPMPTLPR